MTPYEEREAKLRQFESSCREHLLRGELEIGEEVAREYLIVARDASEQWHASAQCCLGLILENAGRYEEALQHAQAAQSDMPFDSRNWLCAAGLIANIHLNQRDYSAAKTQLLRVLDSKTDSAFAHCGLAGVALRSSDVESARAHASTALELACSRDDREFMSVAHNLLGDIELDSGDTAKAEKHFLAALAISEELGRRRGISVACDNLSSIEGDRKNYDACLEYGWRAVQAEIEMGRKAEVGNVSYRVAFRLTDADQDEVLLAGITLWQAAFEEATEPEYRVYSLQQKSLFQRKVKHDDEAELSLNKAMQHLDASDEQMAATWRMLGVVQRERKNFSAAQKSFNRSLELAQEFDHVAMERCAHVSLGYCAIDRRDVFQAHQHWRRALEIAETQRDQGAITHLHETLELYRPNLAARMRLWLLDRRPRS